jgi:hypothetical protein
VKKNRFIEWVRTIAAVFCAIIGLYALTKDDAGFFGFGFLVLGIFVYGHRRWSRWSTLGSHALRLLRAINDRTTSVMLKECCSIEHEGKFCGAPAYFELTLEGAHDTMGLPAPEKIRCCCNHFPITPEGFKESVWAGETLAMLNKQQRSIKHYDMIWRPF